MDLSAGHGEEVTTETKHRLWGWCAFWYALCGRCSRVWATGKWQASFDLLCNHVEREHGAR
jgi:hypothetical protein